MPPGYQIKLIKLIDKLTVNVCCIMNKINVGRLLPNHSIFRPPDNGVDLIFIFRYSSFSIGRVINEAPPPPRKWFDARALFFIFKTTNIPKLQIKIGIGIGTHYHLDSSVEMRLANARGERVLQTYVLIGQVVQFCSSCSIRMSYQNNNRALIG